MGSARYIHVRKVSGPGMMMLGSWIEYIQYSTQLYRHTTVQACNWTDIQQYSNKKVVE